MLKIEKFVTPSPEQWEIIIEGMRNPLNSHHRMDSEIIRSVLVGEEIAPGVDSLICERCEPYISIGENDHDLMMRLNNGGPVHAKYRRMIPVWVTLTAPLLWWKEFDTYKIGTVCNSCSTMHKIHANEFTIDDFSHEHLLAADDIDGFFYSQIAEEELGSIDILSITIEALNEYRKRYLETKDKRYWQQMIYHLPTSYNQKRTLFLNYEVLKNIYESRKDHKLPEWHTLCDWISELPYSELIIGEQD